MGKSPAYRWYPKDALTSLRVAEMSLEEEGAYRRALDLCWLNGSLPSDPERLAKVIGKGASVLVARVVLAMFISDEHDPSKVVHDRLEEERQKQQEWSEKSAKGGRASAGKPKKIKQKTKQQGGNDLVGGLVEPNERIPFAFPSSFSRDDIDEKSKTERAVYVGTVLAGITKTLNVNHLSHSQEREWTLAADLEYENGFTATEFVDCFAELVSSKKYVIKPQYVIDQLPAFTQSHAKGNGSKPQWQINIENCSFCDERGYRDRDGELITCNHA